MSNALQRYRTFSGDRIDTPGHDFYNERAMEKRRKFIINFLYFTIILGVGFLLIKFGLPLLAPFVIGFLIAYLLKHPIAFLAAKTKVPQKAAAVFLVLVFYATIGMLLVMGSIKAFSAATHLVGDLPQMFRSHVVPVLTQLFRELEDAVYRMDPTLLEAVDYLQNHFMQTLGQLVSSLSMDSMQLISSFASSLPMLFIKLVLMIISTLFIAMDYERLTGFCMRQLEGRAKEIFLQVKQYIIGTLFVCIRSYALIMSITFVELSIGLTLIGVDSAILVALCIAVFDILPVLGTGGIMIPWAVITALLGDYSLAFQLCVVYVAITVVRNIIEPKIVGSQLGLHPVVTLASMFAGAQLVGVVGLFGFPIGLSLLKHLNDTGAIHIFKAPDANREECS